MAQRQVLLTGIGGQGIQLSAKTLAMAAVVEGREAVFLGHFSATMRGGQTDASIVVGDAPLRALPILDSAWSAMVMSDEFWHDTNAKIPAGGVIVVNSTLVHDLGRDDCQNFDVPASDIAGELGAAMSAGYVLLGGYAAITGMVGIESLVAAMRELVPAYRTEHLTANEAALRAGYETAPSLAAPAWEAASAAGVAS